MTSTAESPAGPARAHELLQDRPERVPATMAELDTPGHGANTGERAVACPVESPSGLVAQPVRDLAARKARRPSA